MTDPLLTNSVAENSFTNASSSEWTTYTVTYTATGTDAGHQIGIWLTTNSYQELYDNVRLSVIPEPATLSLLGLGGLTLMLRKRRRA